uniref:Uncharacterized protein n=1 Tax=Panagrolaimus sp. ES5 TaxID=591445 RepID=A0AC34GQ65_9BILA
MFEGHISDVHSLAASDNILVSGSKDNEAFVWDLQTGKKFMELPGHPTTIRAVKIVPQYSLVVTGSSFHMRLWDLRIGKCETLFQSSGLVTDKYEKCGHHNYIPPGEDEIKAFDIDSTGHYLFSNSRGSIRCWDLRKQQAYGRISGDDEFHITSISVQSAENANDGVKVFCGHTRKNMEEYGTVSIFKTPYDQAKTVFPVFQSVKNANDSVKVFCGHTRKNIEENGTVSIFETPYDQAKTDFAVCLPFNFAVTDVIPDEKVFFCSDIRGVSYSL